jgi:acyl-CoA dehydrogenase
LNFDLTEDQRDIYNSSFKLGSKFSAKYWRDKDSKSEFPTEFWTEACANGLPAIPFPVDYGGLGLGLFELLISVEALSRSGAGMDGGSIFPTGPAYGGLTILNHGTKSQKDEFLPRICKGALISLALTETESGSNVTKIKTFAFPVKSNEGTYEINGSKQFISVAREAKNVIIAARTKEYSQVQRKTEGIGLFICDLPSNSISFQTYRKCGFHMIDTSELLIKGLQVPRERALGGVVDKGWDQITTTLNASRLIFAISALGTGALCLDIATSYAKTRKIWDEKPIGSHQAVAFPLVEAYVALEVAKLQVYKAGWLHDQGRDFSIEASVAKFQAVNAAFKAADEAMQTLGGMGYMAESDVERHWRNIRLMKIVPITQQMTANFLATKALGLPRSY